MKTSVKTRFALFMSLFVVNAVAGVPFDLSAVDEQLRERICNAQNHEYSESRSGLWMLCGAYAIDSMKVPEKQELYKIVARYCIRRGEIESRDFVGALGVEPSWNQGLWYLFLEYDREDLFDLISEERSNSAMPSNFDIINTWKPYAETGDPVAMFYLAREYDHVNKKALGLRWMKASAEAGLLRAQWTLYRWYAHGSGYIEEEGLSLDSYSNRIVEENSSIYGGRVQYDAYESIRWLFRIGLQDPTCGLVSCSKAVFTIKLSSLSGNLEASKSIINNESVREYSKQRVSESPYWPIDIKVIQQAYVYESYQYFSTDDDLRVQVAGNNLVMFAKFLSVPELEEAKLMAKAWRPQMELNPDYPLAQQPNSPAVASDPQFKRQIFVPNKPLANGETEKSIENEYLEIDRARLRNEQESVREQSRQANEQKLLQERALAEMERTNRLREQQEQNKQTLDGMKSLTDQLNKQYPTYDPLAPGTRNNPYTIEVK